MRTTRADRTILAHAAASSTTPLEAVVVLESAGLSDRTVVYRFGTSDVFALAERALADPDRGVSEPMVPHAPPGRSTPGDRWWFLLRGLLYAVPAVVALSLLPSGDSVASGLVLGGLVLAWASGYGVTSIAWSHLGNLDRPGAQRFLLRALLVGTLLALLGSTAAVFLALTLTSTMTVDLTTILLLTGQATYLLAATVLMMCRKEPWLLVALVPAAVGAVIGLLVPRGGPVSALGAVPTAVPARDLLWPAASVVLAVVFAVGATQGARRPMGRLPRSAWSRAGRQVGYGLFVAVLVVFPALDQMLDPGFDPLPLSVTLVALPLVLSMGVAESLVLRFRQRAERLLSSTGSTARFARETRTAALRAHLTFAGALTVATVVFGMAVVATGARWDTRLVLLGADYLVLGTALFAATMLTVLGCGDRVLIVLAAGVTGLSAFLARSEQAHASSTAAILWHFGTGAVLLVVLALVVRRTAGIPELHR